MQDVFSFYGTKELRFDNIELAFFKCTYLAFECRKETGKCSYLTIYRIKNDNAQIVFHNTLLIKNVFINGQ